MAKSSEHALNLHWFRNCFQEIHLLFYYQRVFFICALFRQSVFLHPPNPWVLVVDVDWGWNDDEEDDGDDGRAGDAGGGGGGDGGGASPCTGEPWLKTEGISCKWFTHTKYSIHILIPGCAWL